MIYRGTNKSAWKKASKHKTKSGRKISYKYNDCIDEFEKKIKLSNSVPKSLMFYCKSPKRFQKKEFYRPRKIHYYKNKQIRYTLNHSYSIVQKIDETIVVSSRFIIQSKISDLSNELISWSIQKVFNISFHSINIIVDVGKITISLNKIYKNRNTYKLVIDIVDNKNQISGNYEELKNFYILHKDLVIEIIKLSRDCVLL